MSSVLLFRQGLALLVVRSFWVGLWLQPLHGDAATRRAMADAARAAAMPDAARRVAEIVMQEARA